MENFLLLVSYRLNAREKQQSQKLLERLGQSRDKLSAPTSTDDALYLPMEPGQPGDGYVSLEANSKPPDGYSEVKHPDDEAGMYSYADPQRLIKLPGVRVQNEKGEYVGVERERRKETEKEEDGDNPGYINVGKDGGYIAVSEGGQDGSKEGKGDGYLEILSDKSPTGGAKKTKKKDKKKPAKLSIADDNGEVEGSQKTPNGDGSGSPKYSLLSRMGTRMKGALTKKRRPSGGEKSPTHASFKGKHDETKPRVPVADLPNPTFEGILQRRKQGMGRANWETGMWYILHNHTLYYCSSNDNEYATKDFPVFTYTVKPFEGKHQDNAFELSHPGVNSVVFRAENTEQRDKWIEALTQATLIDELSIPNSQATAEDQDVYENANDESPGKPNEPAMEEPDVYENPESPIAPKPSKTPKKLSRDTSAVSEKTYENVDIELYEDVEEEQSVFHAIKSHQATDDDELSFETGALILMDNMDNASWWVGTLQNKATREFTGERGFVPKAYFVPVTFNS